MVYGLPADFAVSTAMTYGDERLQISVPYELASMFVMKEWRARALMSRTRYLQPLVAIGHRRIGAAILFNLPLLLPHNASTENRAPQSKRPLGQGRRLTLRSGVFNIDQEFFSKI